MKRSKSHGKETLLNDIESLKHTRWECKYHIVFIPKYRRKALYGALRQRMGSVLRELAVQRESRIEQGHLMLDHMHMLISIPPKYSVAQVVGYIKGNSAIYITDVHGQAAKLRRREFLGTGILRLDGGTRREDDPGVHQEPRAGRPTDRPTQHIQQVATSSGSKTQTALSGSQH